MLALLIGMFLSMATPGIQEAALHLRARPSGLMWCMDPVVPSEPLSDVLAFGDMASLADLDRLARLVVEISGDGPEETPLVLDSQGRLAGSDDLGWVDTASPASYLLLSPKRHEKPYAAALPVRSLELLEAELPTSVLPLVPDTDFKIVEEGHEYWARLSGRKLIIGPTAESVATLSAALNGRSASPPCVDVRAVVSVPSLLREYRSEVSAHEAMFRLTLGAPLSLLGQKLGLSGIALPDELIALLEQSKAIRFEATAEEKEFRLAASLVPPPGLGERLVQAMKARTRRMVERLPPAPYIEASWHVAPDGPLLGIPALLDLLSRPLKLGAEEKAELARLLDQALSSRTGDVAIAIHATRFGFPFNVDVVIGLANGTGTREALVQVVEFVYRRIQEQPEVREAAISMIMRWDKTLKIPPGSGLTQIFHILGATGIRLTAEDRQVGPSFLSWVELRLDLDKMVETLDDGELPSMAAAWLPDASLQVAVLLAPDSLHIAVGDTALSRLEEEARILAEPAPQPRAAIRPSGDGLGGVKFLVDFPRLFQALSNTPESILSRNRMEQLPSEGRVVLLLEAPEGERLSLSLRLPRSLNHFIHVFNLREGEREE